MTLPSDVAGTTTETVGFFEAPASTLAEWFVDSTASRWVASHSRWPDAASGYADLAPQPVLSQRAFVPVTGTWTALFTNGPLGTDVGVLPERAARDLRVRGIRAVHIARGRVWPARTLEVNSPSGAESGVTSRVLYSTNDGGRWRFWNSGEPFTFEESADYSQLRKSDRFNADTLSRCLRHLAVPIDVEPDWRAALVVRKA